MNLSTWNMFHPSFSAITNQEYNCHFLTLFCLQIDGPISHFSTAVCLILCGSCRKLRSLITSYTGCSWVFERLYCGFVQKYRSKWYTYEAFDERCDIYRCICNNKRLFNSYSTFSSIIHLYLGSVISYHIQFAHF